MDKAKALACQVAAGIGQENKSLRGECANTSMTMCDRGLPVSHSATASAFPGTLPMRSHHHLRARLAPGLLPPAHPGLAGRGARWIQAAASRGSDQGQRIAPVSVSKMST